jgi:nitroimidazol reductase NimA-like FMN-containing flavoprotein (pyridoxamine 5'-phosphate oxidase superfamily)
MTDDAPLEFSREARNQVRRLPDRAHYDHECVYRIVDEALICHVGLVEDGQPFVLPTIHARMEDTLVLHGAPASRLLKYAAAGRPLCVTVTLLDGLVMARSAFHNSINYRSAVLFGTGRLAKNENEKRQALETLNEHVAHGRWADARPPSSRELNATAVVLMTIESASAKQRSGPPQDDQGDLDLPVWAGVLPLALQAGEPQPDSHTPAETPAPEYLSRYARGR